MWTRFQVYLKPGVESFAGADHQRALFLSFPPCEQRSETCNLESILVYVDSQVESFAERDLLDGAWIEDCALLVVPGGADLPYCRQLNGAGNCLIRREHPAFSASRFFLFCRMTMLCSSFPLTGLCAPTTMSLSSDSVTGLMCQMKLLVSYKFEAEGALPGAACSHSASNKHVHLHAPSRSNSSCCPFTPVWYTTAHASQRWCSHQRPFLL